MFALVATERRRAADMFEGLDDRQWATPTLCTAWTVRDMAGHLTLPFLVSKPRAVLGILANRGSFDRWSTQASRAAGARPAAELVATLRDRATSRWTPPGKGASAPLTDVCVHTRDVARPLGLDVSAPTATWRVVLEFLTSAAARGVFVPKGRLDGLALRATDQDWATGDGAEAAGPSEALALSLLGRASALDDLSGDGVVVLAEHL